MTRDCIFLSPDSYLRLKRRTLANLVDQGDAALANRPFMGIPFAKADDLPHWIQWLSVGRVSGERVAYVTGGRLFHWTGLRGRGIVFEGAQWSRDPKPADRAGTCLLSLAAIEPGDLVARPLVIEEAKGAKASPEARILWSAIEAISGYPYPPPGRQIAPGSPKP